VWQPSVYTLRSSIEIAGNAMYGLSSLLGDERSGGAYKLFGIQYAQYVKAEVDYTYTCNFNDRNTLAFHVGAGVGVPYGNSSMMPFEKRFYSGGANSVRGGGVRTLGQGSYNSQTSVTNFINQCGDIRFDMSLEYRAKLFWLVEGALFVDAGNIWTIHNYENQPGGMFKFDRFYKEIAAAYGIGLRLDFTYFLIRLDMGMKAYNPAENQERWPLVHPDFGRDATFHFSVGYPF
ncbi:MAG: BamA/TamA family outer membrane protein, partial [Muribaculaceae bacterium]|nr:BamA/TamA family outer membrane protein [Muribaculaceae bacterium]